MLRYAQAMIIPIVLGILISYALEPLVSAPEQLQVSTSRSPRRSFWHLRSASAARSSISCVSGQRRRSKTPRGGATVAADARTGKAGGVERHPADAEGRHRTWKAAEAAGPTPPRPPAGVTRVQVEAAPLNVSEYLGLGIHGRRRRLGQLVLVMFLAYFLLASGDLYRRKLVKIAGPSLTQKRVTVQILEEIDRQIESFLLVQLFTSALVGIASWLVFRWIGLEQAGVWGLLAGVFNSIPYFGPVLVTGGTAVDRVSCQFGRFEEATLVAGAAFAITTLEGFLLTPWLTSRAARMNAVASSCGLIFWGWVWDVWGLLLAVPMLMVVKAICDHVEDFSERRRAAFGE